MSGCMQGDCICGTENQTCTNILSQYTKVSVPIRIKPCAEVGELIADCYGEPTITVRQCQNSNCECGCDFVITQCICIQIPMEYSVESNVGSTAFTCNKMEDCNHNICK
ncbi:MAG: hypothetical protein RR275_05055 [Lachnospiraceae bacterium]